MVRLSLPGYEDHGVPGEPLLPERVLMVAVPPSGTVRVHALGLDPEVREGVVLAPQPHVARGAESEPLEYRRSPSGYAPGARMPERAHLLDVSWMRNQRVARIAVTPADFDPGAARITLYRRIDVEVEVDPSGELGPRAEDPDPFEGVYADVLVNYEQGKRWRRPAAAEPGAGRSGGRFAPATLEGTGVFFGRSWVKIAVPSTGFYRVNYGILRTLDPFSGLDSVRVDSLRLFTWPGFPVLSENSYCDSCDYREVAIGIIDAHNDSAFTENDEDALYFYALGASDWADRYDPARPDTVFINHPYETKSYYYLTVGTAGQPVPGPPLRIVPQPVSPHDASAVTPATFPARAHYEVDSPSEYFPDATSEGSTIFWEKWFWRSINMGTAFVASAGAPGADTTQAARLRLRLWGVARSCDECTCALLDPVAHQADVQLNGVSLGRFRWGHRNVRFGSLPFTVDTTLLGLHTAGNVVRVFVPPVACASRVDKVAIAWFDLFYRHRFEPEGDVLAFDSPSGSGSYLYQVGPFVNLTPPRIFDVTDPYRPLEIVAATYGTAGGVGRLSFEVRQGGTRRYRIVQDSSIVVLPRASVAMALATTSSEGGTDLRSTTNAKDYVVVFYDGFKAAADTLGKWREIHPGYDVMEVPVSALYDQFSGGRTDPAAIRSFLRAAYRWQKKPKFVTLLGDASYDFKNYLGRAAAGQPGTLVPAYENGFDDAVSRQYSTDDWMLNALDHPGDRGPVPDYFGGRIPAGDAATAMDVVRNKILLYERSALLGE